MKKLAVVILNYNTKGITVNCLESIFKNNIKFSKNDVYLVDNNSSDGSVKTISKKFVGINIIKNPKNDGFARGNNLALRKIHKKYEYVLLLNSDTVVSKDIFAQALKQNETFEFDIFSVRLTYPNGKFQPNAGRLPNLLHVFVWLSGLDDIFRKIYPLPSYQERGLKFYKNGRQVGWVSGSFMMIKSRVFEKIGFLDEKIFMYGEDVDFCLRAAKNGFKIGFINRCSIVHIGGASSDKPKISQWKGEFLGLKYLYRKHYSIFGQLILAILIYVFILVRILVFLLIGKSDVSMNYAKIIKTI